MLDTMGGDKPMHICMFLKFLPHRAARILYLVSLFGFFRLYILFFFNAETVEGKRYETHKVFEPLRCLLAYSDIIITENVGLLTAC